MIKTKKKIISSNNKPYIKKFGNTSYGNYYNNRDNRNIRRVSSMNTLLSVNANIILLDLEETVLMENIYYEILSLNTEQAKRMRGMLYNLCSKNDLSMRKVMYYGKHFIRQTLEKCTRSVIEQLNQKGKRVVALTSGYPSLEKYLTLKNLNIVFEDILCTRRKPKGPFLWEYITNNHLQKYTFAFMDNHLSKLRSVRDTFKKYKSLGNIELLHYVPKKKNKSSISDNEFLSYWLRVIKIVQLYTN